MEVDRLEIAIRADAGKANAQLKILIGNLNGVSTALRGGNSALGQTHISASIAARSVAKLSAQVTGINRLTGSFRSLMRVLLPILSIRALFNWGKNAMETSSQLTEVQNVIRKTYGDYSGLIEEFAAGASSEVGMSELTAKKIASRYQAMGTSMGIAQGQMADMSIELTRLAGNMASFYDADIEDVGTALQSVFTGQTRALRQYGIDITQATVQEWAMKKGIDANMQSMTQATKALLRYGYVMEATKEIGSDFIDTIDTWHNQTVLLKQAFIALSTSIGGALINIFKPVLSWLNRVMTSVIAVVENIINALGFIFGWKFEVTGGGAGMTEGYEAIGDALDDVAGDAGDAAKNLEQAEEEAEELKTVLLGFDEINRLPEPPKKKEEEEGGGSGSGSGSGGGAGGASDNGLKGNYTKVEPEYQRYISDIDSLKELGVYISNTLKDAMLGIDWSGIYDKLRGFGKGLADFLNGLINPGLFSTLGATIANAINAALHGIDAFLDHFDWSNLGKSIAAGINSFWDLINLNLAADNFARIVNGIAEAFARACEDIKWYKIGDKIGDSIRRALEQIDWLGRVFIAARRFGEGLAQFLNGLIKPETFAVIGSTLANVLNAKLHFLDTFGDTFDFANFGDSIAAGVMGIFDTFNFRLLGRVFNKWALGVLASLRHAIGGVDWESVGQRINTTFRTIKWPTILSEAATLLWEGLNAAVDFAKGLFDGTPFTHVFETIEGVLSSIQENVDFSAIVSGFTNLAEALAPFVVGFAEGLIDVFGFFSELGLTFLEGLAKVIDKIANAIKMIPQDTLETIGRVLGQIVGYLLVLKGVQSVIDKVTGLIITLGGGGAAAGAAGAAAAGGAAAGGAAGIGVKTALGNIVNNIGKFASNYGPSIGAGGLFAGLVTGAVTAAIKLQELFETANGGNGTLTEFGGAVDSLSGRLTGAGVVTGDWNTELFLNKETLETSGASIDQWASTLALRFDEAGLSSEYLTYVIGELATTSGLTDDQMELLRLTVEKMGTSSSLSATEVEAAYDGMSAALGEYVESGKLAKTEANGLLDTFKQQITQGLPVETAYQRIRNELQQMGISTEELDRAVQQHMPGAFGSIADGADAAAESTAGLESNAGTFALGSAIKAIAMAVLGTAYEKIGLKAEGAETLVDNFATFVGDFASGVKEHAKETLDGGEKMSTGIGTGMLNKKNDVKSAAEDVGNEGIAGLYGVLDIANGRSGKGEEAGKFYDIGLASGIDSSAGDVLTSVSSLTAGIVDGAASGLGVHSPSTIAADQGYNYGLGMANGLDDSLVEVTRAVESISDAIVFGMPSELYYQGQDAATSFARGMQSVHIPTPHFYISGWNYHDLGNGGYQYTPSWKVQWYAQGGFPNKGEMFVANENGIEMMGKMGSKNVVANNAQITEGIAKAVASSMYSAVSAALKENSGSNEVNVVLEGDAKGLFKVVRKEGINYQQMTGRAVFN